MLVLSRRKDQSIRIGNDIRVIVLEVRGEQVSIGIEAPRSVDIYREEVFKEVLSQNIAAAQADTSAEKQKTVLDDINFTPMSQDKE